MFVISTKICYREMLFGYQTKGVGQVDNSARVKLEVPRRFCRQDSSFKTYSYIGG
jgi:hypothetical protein